MHVCMHTYIHTMYDELTAVAPRQSQRMHMDCQRIESNWRMGNSSRHNEALSGSLWSSYET